MSPWPYRFIMSVSPEDLQRRREVLDLKGQYAQISALVLLALFCVLKLRGNNNINNTKHAAKSWWNMPAKSGASETRKQYAVTALWLLWLSGIAAWNAKDDYIHLTKALGHVGLSQLPFLALLAPTSFLFPVNTTSHSIVSTLTSIPQTTLTAYHRLLGRFVIVPLVCGHAGLFLNFYLQVAVPGFSNLFNKRVRDQDVQFGLAATTIAILILVFGRSRVWKLRGWIGGSTPEARGRIFYIVHLTLVGVFFAFAYSHVGFARPFVLESIAISLTNVVGCKLLAPK